MALDDIGSEVDEPEVQPTGDLQERPISDDEEFLSWVVRRLTSRRSRRLRQPTTAHAMQNAASSSGEVPIEPMVPEEAAESSDSDTSSSSSSTSSSSTSESRAEEDAMAVAAPVQRQAPLAVGPREQRGVGVMVPYGPHDSTITAYPHLGIFVAHCKAPGHGVRCRLTRSMNENPNPTGPRVAQGRPLGLLAA